jgi:hypothetical protein
VSEWVEKEKEESVAATSKVDHTHTRTPPRRLFWERTTLYFKRGVKGARVPRGLSMCHVRVCVFVLVCGFLLLHTHTHTHL